MTKRGKKSRKANKPSPVVGFGLNQVRHRRKRQKTAAAEKTTMVACKFKTPNSVMTKATCRSLSHAATLHFSHKEQKIVMRNKLFKSVLFLFVSAACLLSQPYYYGVNLSSAEFGSTVPGPTVRPTSIPPFPRLTTIITRDCVLYGCLFVGAAAAIAQCPAGLGRAFAHGRVRCGHICT